MTAFQYAALDSSGRTLKGLLEGDTPRHVRQLLRERGLLPVSVEAVAGEAGATDSTPSVRRRRARLNATELALITRQIATLVASGLPVEEALGAVSRQASRARIASVLLAVRARIMEGHDLATALGEFPRVFPELYRSTVRAGEQSGHLDVVLERLADYTEARQVLRQRVGLALFYPLILTTVAVLIVAGLLTYVVPQVVQVFTSVGQDLPLLTRALIASSDFLRAHGALLLFVVVAVAVAGRMALRRPAVRRRWHRLVLHLPLIGHLARGLNAARYARTFSILTASGVPVLEGLKISAEVVTNLPMRDAVEQAAARVRAGASLSRALNDTGQFPPMTVQLIASGEASGRMETMLDRAAQQQERETETVISAALGMMEPILILVMGVVVLLIVLAILLPLFDLNQLVRL